MAQSLHDELGHSLSLVALNLSRVELDSALPENLRSIISSAREDLGKAVEQLGDSVVALRLGAKPAPGATGT
ncbi:histidine kinase [Corynebacterium striatum]